MATKNKMLMSGERYAIVKTDNGRVIETRFVGLVTDKEGNPITVKVAIPDGCKAYPAPVGTVGIAKGRLVSEVPGLREIVEEADAKIAEAAEKRAEAKTEEKAA